MNYNPIFFYDFETGSRLPKNTQPIQIAGVMIHSRKLELIPGSEFNSLIKPLSDEEALEKGWAPITDEALEVNKIKREDLEKAPKLEVVYREFGNHINHYNFKNNKWSAPVKAGFNNNGFDDIILDRVAKRCGEWYDKEREECTLFHPIHSIDVMKYMWMWTENMGDIRSISMDKLREWLGMSTDNAHNALVDSMQGAELLCRLLQLVRRIAPTVKFKGAFGE
jgi:DNA polymerase III epsilon subunit-like protein